MSTEKGSSDFGHRRLFSDGFLGTLVVLLTVATAFSAYQSALTSIKGDDLDFEAQKTLLIATSSYLSGNTEFLEDLQNYDSYRLFAESDPAEAAVYLDRASRALREGLERPGGPFDEAYREARFGDAVALVSDVTDIEQQANLADDKVRIFELAGLIFTVGLAAVAWTTLMDERPRVRMVFLIISLVCLIIGAAVIVQVVFI